MSKITVHAHPEGFLLKSPDDVPINGVDLTEVSFQITEALAERFAASLTSKSFTEVVRLGVVK